MGEGDETSSGRRTGKMRRDFIWKEISKKFRADHDGSVSVSTGSLAARLGRQASREASVASQPSSNIQEKDGSGSAPLLQTNSSPSAGNGGGKASKIHPSRLQQVSSTASSLEVMEPIPAQKNPGWGNKANGKPPTMTGTNAEMIVPREGRFGSPASRGAGSPPLASEATLAPNGKDSYESGKRTRDVDPSDTSNQRKLKMTKKSMHQRSPSLELSIARVDPEKSSTQSKLPHTPTMAPTLDSPAFTFSIKGRAQNSPPTASPPQFANDSPLPTVQMSPPEFTTVSNPISLMTRISSPLLTTDQSPAPLDPVALANLAKTLSSGGFWDGGLFSPVVPEPAVEAGAERAAEGGNGMEEPDDVAMAEEDNQPGNGSNEASGEIVSEVAPDPRQYDPSKTASGEPALAAIIDTDTNMDLDGNDRKEE
ncbi:hypothetical protein T439DRAFT_243348 [Meredithblackwellia eburnea MCA 4105]